MRTSQLDELKANFDAGARGNLFGVLITTPSTLGFQFAEEDMLRCTKATMNGSKLGTKKRDQYNSGYEMPDGTVDQGGTFSLSFLCDSGFHDRALLEAWHRYIYEADYIGDLGTGTMGSAQIPVMRYLNDYVSEVTVMALRKDQSTTMKTVYSDAYPVSYNAIEFSTDADGIIQVDIDFAFRHYDTEYVVEDRKEAKKYKEILDAKIAAQPENSSTINKGSLNKYLDTALDVLKVGSRFNSKAGDYFKKLSNLESAGNRARNIKRDFDTLFGG